MYKWRHLKWCCHLVAAFNHLFRFLLHGPYLGNIRKYLHVFCFLLLFDTNQFSYQEYFVRLSQCQRSKPDDYWYVISSMLIKRAGEISRLIAELYKSISCLVCLRLKAWWMPIVPLSLHSGSVVNVRAGNNMNIITGWDSNISTPRFGFFLSPDRSRPGGFNSETTNIKGEF